MNTTSAAELAAQDERWYTWQVRYDRARRRSSIEERIVAIIVFSAIAVDLLVHFVSASPVA